MTDLYFLYDMYHTGGAVREGEEDLDYPSRGDQYQHNDFLGVVSRVPPENRTQRESVEVPFTATPGMSVFAVLVHYDTGDTFGQRKGRFYLEGIYDDMAKADKVAKSIANKTYKGYKAWDGYFEVYNGTEVITFMLDQRVSY